MPTLHVHADEAGDFNFAKPAGSSHYIFTVAWTRDPYSLAGELAGLRYSLIKSGHDIPQFHACQDTPKTKLAVIDLLMAYDSWRFCSLVVRKDRVFAALRQPDRFYPRFLGYALKFVFRGRVDARGVCVFFCSLRRA